MKDCLAKWHNIENLQFVYKKLQTYDKTLVSNNVCALIPNDLSNHFVVDACHLEGCPNSNFEYFLDFFFL